MFAMATVEDFPPIADQAMNSPLFASARKSGLTKFSYVQKRIPLTVVLPSFAYTRVDRWSFVKTSDVVSTGAAWHLGVAAITT